MTGSAGAVRDLGPDELADWDAMAVDAPGGHVLQSRAWAEHRRSTGWRPRFLAAGDARALVLERPWPLVGGGSAYLPRGPVVPGEPWRPGSESGAAVGASLAAIAVHCARRGTDVLAADPEVRGDDAAYRAGIMRAGFHPIPEIQPSRHRMGLDLPPDGDAAAVFERVAKATRQRIRRAERDGVAVLRWDSLGPDAEGFVRATEDPDAAFARFFELLRATGDRKGFVLGREFMPWWRRAHDAGHLVYLEAREGAADGEVLGGLLLYRHGRRLSTAHSADRAERRRDQPGTMHLLRWRAIELACLERRAEMDLGGVDVAGARRPPVEGEPTYGLYEHKRSFGAQWVELAGAHERVARRWRYGAGRLTAKAARAIGRGSGGG